MVSAAAGVDVTDSDKALYAALDGILKQVEALKLQLVARASADVRPSEPGPDAMARGREFGIDDGPFLRAVRAKEIEGARKIGRSYYAPRSSIRAWLDACAPPKPLPTPAPVESAVEEFDRLLDRARKRTAA